MTRSNILQLPHSESFSGSGKQCNMLAEDDHTVGGFQHICRHAHDKMSVGNGNSISTVLQPRTANCTGNTFCARKLPVHCNSSCPWQLNTHAVPFQPFHHCFMCETLVTSASFYNTVYIEANDKYKGKVSSTCYRRIEG